jgi:hypothetical protein
MCQRSVRNGSIFAKKSSQCVDESQPSGHVLGNDAHKGALMTELLDSKLTAAGAVPTDDVRITEALRSLTADRARAANLRRRRIVIPALSIGLAFGLLGTGAVAASQWGPWPNVPDPDIQIAREWTDVNGLSLGTCESHIGTIGLSPEARTAARDYLATLDIDSIKPDTEMVATLLVALGRPDDLGRLIEGAHVADYDIEATGSTWTGEWWTDARILQDGLTSTVLTSLAKKMSADWPEASNQLSSNIDTQCANDGVGPTR